MSLIQSDLSPTSVGASGSLVKRLKKSMLDNKRYGKNMLYFTMVPSIPAKKSIASAVIAWGTSLTCLSSTWWVCL